MAVTSLGTGDLAHILGHLPFDDHVSLCCAVGRVIIEAHGIWQKRAIATTVLVTRVSSAVIIAGPEPDREGREGYVIRYRRHAADSPDDDVVLHTSRRMFVHTFAAFAKHFPESATVTSHLAFPSAVADTLPLNTTYPCEGLEAWAESKFTTHMDSVYAAMLMHARYLVTFKVNRPRSRRGRRARNQSKVALRGTGAEAGVA